WRHGGAGAWLDPAGSSQSSSVLGATHVVAGDEGEVSLGAQDVGNLALGRQVGATDGEPGAVLQPVHIRDGPPASARALPVLADAQGEARGGAVMAVATEHGPRVLSRRGTLPRHRLSGRSRARAVPRRSRPASGRGSTLTACRPSETPSTSPSARSRPTRTPRRGPPRCSPRSD